MSRSLPSVVRSTAVVLAAAAVASCASESEAPAGQPLCVSDAPVATIDHVTLAVRDLPAARTQVQDLGFRIKDGRLHPNGILNAHAKTRQGSLELLTVTYDGTSDGQSDEYEEFIAEGEGGAFLALAASPLDSIAVRLTALGVAFDLERSNAWDYLTFPRTSALRHVYFFGLKQPANDEDEVLTHMNGASRISGVALDGGPRLVEILEAVGATVCEEADQSASLRLGDAAVTLLPHDTTARGRVRGVQFDVFTLGRPPAEVGGLTLSWTTPN